MLARIIIFEGPDGVGKTTLINYIKEEFGKDAYYMHLRVHKNMKLWHKASARHAIKMKNRGKLVLIDRHWPSEQCYSYIYRNGPSYNATPIYEMLQKERPLYVWCCPEDVSRVKENHRINKEKRHEEYDNIDKVVDFYYQHWFGKPGRNNFLSKLSPLRERDNFIRYDRFKDGHKLDDVKEKIIERAVTVAL